MTYLRSILVALACLLGLMPVPPAVAFNFDIHVIAAESAYQQLPSERQRQLEQEAGLLFNRLSNTDRKLLARYDSSRFAGTTVLPDMWRKRTLPELFEALELPLPNALADLHEKILSRGHYINLAYRPEMGTQPGEVLAEPNITQLFSAMLQAHAQSSGAQRAVITAFLAHLVVDIHQPLHAVTLVDSDNPKGDRGGNNTCVLRQTKPGKNTGSQRAKRRGSKTKCAKNMHILFDEAVWWAHEGRWRKKIDQAITELRYADTERAITWAGLNAVIQESAKLGIDAYQAILRGELETKDGRSRYFQQWQARMKPRLDLASLRLAALLRTL